MGRREVSGPVSAICYLSDKQGKPAETNLNNGRILSMKLFLPVLTVMIGVSCVPVAPVAAQTPPAKAAAPVKTGLPTGLYRCSSATLPGFPHMGYLEIRGTTYRFSPNNKPTGAFAPYELAPGDKREWRSPLGGLGKPPREYAGSGIERGSNYVSVWVKAPSGPKGLVETTSCRFDP